jgi:hypothetical protein
VPLVVFFDVFYAIAITITISGILPFAAIRPA